MCSRSCKLEKNITEQTGDEHPSLPCSCLDGRGCVYDENACLISLGRDNPSELPFITECNTRCSCSRTCRNRVIQKGIRYKLEVFKHDQKGLCLRTLESIKELSFICEYAGEVLSYEEAKSRADKQSANDMNYIFVLREYFSREPVVTYVDPCQRGNIGRFLNHSCKPNSFIVPVRVENMVPRLCVFALRDISPGEEITYDYGSGNTSCTEGDRKKYDGSISERSSCQCMAENCKGYLPFDNTLFQ